MWYSLDEHFHARSVDGAFDSPPRLHQTKHLAFVQWNVGVDSHVVKVADLQMTPVVHQAKGVTLRGGAGSGVRENADGSIRIGAHCR